MNEYNEPSPERAGDMSSPSPSHHQRSTNNKKPAVEILQNYIHHHHKNANSHLKILDLSNTNLDFEFSSLFSIVKLPPQIREISFENCSISEKCINHIITGLNRNPHLPELKTKNMTLLNLTGKPTNKRDVSTILAQYASQNFQNFLRKRDAVTQNQTENRARDIFRFLMELSSQMIRNHQSYGMQIAFEEENEREQIRHALNYLWKIEQHRKVKRKSEDRLLENVRRLFIRQRKDRNEVVVQYCMRTLTLIQRYEELQREVINSQNLAAMRQFYSLRSASFDTHSNLYQLRVRRYATKRVGFIRLETQKRQKLVDEEVDSFAELRGQHFKTMTEMLACVARDEADLADAQKLERNTKYEAFRKRILGLEMERLDRASARQRASTDRLAIFESEMKERGDITDAESKLYDLLKDVETTIRNAVTDKIRIDKMIREAAAVHCFIPRVVLTTGRTTLNPIVSYRDTGCWTDTDPNLSLKLEPLGSWYSEAETARDQLRVAFSNARKTRTQRIRTLKVSWQLINSVYNQMKLEMTFLPVPGTSSSAPSSSTSHQHLLHQTTTTTNTNAAASSSSSVKSSKVPLQLSAFTAISSIGHIFTPEFSPELRFFVTPHTLDDCPDEQERCPPILTKTIEQVVTERCKCELYNMTAEVAIRPYVFHQDTLTLTKFEEQDLQESFSLCWDVEEEGKSFADEMNEKMKNEHLLLNNNTDEDPTKKSSRASTAAATGRSTAQNHHQRPPSSSSKLAATSSLLSSMSAGGGEQQQISPQEALVHHYSQETPPSQRPINLSTSFTTPSSLEEVNEVLRKLKLLALYRHDVTKMTPVHYDPETCTLEKIVEELKLSDFVSEEFLKLQMSDFDLSKKKEETVEQQEGESEEEYQIRKYQFEKDQQIKKQKEQEEKDRKIAVSHDRALDIFRAEQPAAFYSLEWKFTLSFAAGCSDEEQVAKLKIENAKKFEEWQKDQERIAAERKVQIEEYENQLREQKILKEQVAAEKARRKKERLAAKQKKKEEKERELKLQKGELIADDTVHNKSSELMKSQEIPDVDRKEQDRENNDDLFNFSISTAPKFNNNKDDSDDEEAAEETSSAHVTTPKNSSNNNNNNNTATTPTNSSSPSSTKSKPTITVNTIIRLPPLPPPKVQPPPPHVEFEINNKLFTRDSLFGMPVVLLQPSWFPRAYFRTLRQIGEGGAKPLKLAKNGWQVHPVWHVLAGNENIERESRAAMLFGKKSTVREPPPTAPQVICSSNCVVTGNFHDKNYKSFAGFTLEVRIKNMEHGDRIILETGNRFWISAHGSLLRAGTTTNGLAEVDFGSFSSLNERALHRMVFSDKTPITEHDIKSILNMICFKNVDKRPSESVRVIEVRLSPPQLPGPSYRFEIDLRAPDTLPSLISPTKVVSCRVPQKQTFGNYFSNVPHFDLEMVPKLLFAPTKKGKRAQLNSPWFNPVSLEELVDMTQNAASNPVTILFPDTTVTCPDTCSFEGGTITFNFRTGMIADHLWMALPTQPMLDAPGSVFMRLQDDDLAFSSFHHQSGSPFGEGSFNSRTQSRRPSCFSGFNNTAKHQFGHFSAMNNNNNNNNENGSGQDDHLQSLIPSSCFSDENVKSGKLFEFASLYVVLENRQVQSIGKVSCAFFTEEELGLNAGQQQSLELENEQPEEQQPSIFARNQSLRRRSSVKIVENDSTKGNQTAEETKSQHSTKEDESSINNNNSEQKDSSSKQQQQENNNNIREKIGVKEIVIEFATTFEDDNSTSLDATHSLNASQSPFAETASFNFGTRQHQTFLSALGGGVGAGAGDGGNSSMLKPRSRRGSVSIIASPGATMRPRSRTPSMIVKSSNNDQNNTNNNSIVSSSLKPPSRKQQHSPSQNSYITVSVVEKIIQSARFTTLTPYKTEFGGRDINLLVKWNDSDKATPSQVQRRKKRSNVLESTVRVNILNSLLRPPVAATQTASSVAGAAIASIRSKKDAARNLSAAAKVPETVVEVSKGMSLIRSIELPEQPEDNAIIETKQFPVGSFLRFDLTGNFEIGDTLRIDKPEVPKDLVIADGPGGASSPKKESKLQSTLPQDNVNQPPAPHLPDISRWNIEDLPHEAGLVNMWLQEVPKSVWETQCRRQDLCSRRKEDRSALPFADVPPCSDPECVLDYHTTRQLCASKSGTIDVESFWFNEWKKRCERRHAPPSMMGEGTKADWPWPPFSAFNEVYSCSDADQLVRGFGSGVFNIDQTMVMGSNGDFGSPTSGNNNNKKQDHNNNNKNTKSSSPIMKLKGGLSAARANIPRAMVPKQHGVDFFKGNAFSRWFFESPDDVYVYAIKRGHATIARIYVCPRSVLFVTTSPKVQKQDLFAMSLMISLGCTKPLPDSMRKLGRWTLFDGSSFSSQVVPIRVNPVPRPIGMQIKNAPRSRLYRFGSLPIARLWEEIIGNNTNSNDNNNTINQLQQKKLELTTSGGESKEEQQQLTNNNNNNALFLEKIKQIGLTAMPHNRALSERDIALGDGPFRPFGINELVVNAPEPEFFTWKHGCFFTVESMFPSQEDAFGLLSVEAQVEFYKEYLRSKKVSDEEDNFVPMLAVIPFDDQFTAATTSSAIEHQPGTSGSSSSLTQTLDWLIRVHEDAIKANVHAAGLSGSIGRTPDSVLYRLFENTNSHQQQQSSASNKQQQSTSAAATAAVLPWKLRLLDVSSYQKSCSEAVTVMVEKKVPISTSTQDLINETDYNYMDLDLDNQVANMHQKIFDVEPENYYEDFAHYYEWLQEGEEDEFGNLISMYRFKRTGSTPSQRSVQQQQDQKQDPLQKKLSVLRQTKSFVTSPIIRGTPTPVLATKTNSFSGGAAAFRESTTTPSVPMDLTATEGELHHVLSLGDLRGTNILSSPELLLSIPPGATATNDTGDSSGEAALLRREITEIMMPDAALLFAAAQQQQQQLASTTKTPFLDLIMSIEPEEEMKYLREIEKEDEQNRSQQQQKKSEVNEVQEEDFNNEEFMAMLKRAEMELSDEALEKDLPITALELVLSLCEEQRVPGDEPSRLARLFMPSADQEAHHHQPSENDLQGTYFEQEIDDNNISQNDLSFLLLSVKQNQLMNLELESRMDIFYEYSGIISSSSSSLTSSSSSLSFVWNMMQQQQQLSSIQNVEASSIEEARRLFVRSQFEHRELQQRHNIRLESLSVVFKFSPSTSPQLLSEKPSNNVKHAEEERSLLISSLTQLLLMKQEMIERMKIVIASCSSAAAAARSSSISKALHDEYNQKMMIDLFDCLKDEDEDNSLLRKTFVQAQLHYNELVKRHDILIDGLVFLPQEMVFGDSSQHRIETTSDVIGATTSLVTLQLREADQQLDEEKHFLTSSLTQNFLQRQEAVQRLNIMSMYERSPFSSKTFVREYMNYDTMFLSNDDDAADTLRQSFVTSQLELRELIDRQVIVLDSLRPSFESLQTDKKQQQQQQQQQQQHDQLVQSRDDTSDDDDLTIERNTLTSSLTLIFLQKQEAVQRLKIMSMYEQSPLSSNKIFSREYMNYDLFLINDDECPNLLRQSFVTAQLELQELLHRHDVVLDSLRPRFDSIRVDNTEEQSQQHEQQEEMDLNDEEKHFLTSSLTQNFLQKQEAVQRLHIMSMYERSQTSARSLANEYMNYDMMFLSNDDESADSLRQSFVSSQIELRELIDRQFIVLDSLRPPFESLQIDKKDQQQQQKHHQLVETRDDTSEDDDLKIERNALISSLTLIFLQKQEAVQRLKIMSMYEQSPLSSNKIFSREYMNYDLFLINDDECPNLLRQSFVTAQLELQELLHRQDVVLDSLRPPFESLQADFTKRDLQQQQQQQQQKHAVQHHQSDHEERHFLTSSLTQLFLFKQEALQRLHLMAMYEKKSFSKIFVSNEHLATNNFFLLDRDGNDSSTEALQQSFIHSQFEYKELLDRQSVVLESLQPPVSFVPLASTLPPRAPVSSPIITRQEDQQAENHTLRQAPVVQDYHHRQTEQPETTAESDLQNERRFLTSSLTQNFLMKQEALHRIKIMSMFESSSSSPSRPASASLTTTIAFFREYLDDFLLSAQEVDVDDDDIESSIDSLRDSFVTSQLELQELTKRQSILLDALRFPAMTRRFAFDENKQEEQHRLVQSHDETSDDDDSKIERNALTSSLTLIFLQKQEAVQRLKIMSMYEQSPLSSNKIFSREYMNYDLFLINDDECPNLLRQSFVTAQLELQELLHRQDVIIDSLRPRFDSISFDSAERQLQQHQQQEEIDLKNEEKQFLTASLTQNFLQKQEALQRLSIMSMYERSPLSSRALANEYMNYDMMFLSNDDDSADTLRQSFVTSQLELRELIHRQFIVLDSLRPPFESLQADVSKRDLQQEQQEHQVEQQQQQKHAVQYQKSNHEEQHFLTSSLTQLFLFKQEALQRVKIMIAYERSKFSISNFIREYISDDNIATFLCSSLEQQDDQNDDDYLHDEFNNNSEPTTTDSLRQSFTFAQLEYQELLGRQSIILESVQLSNFSSTVGTMTMSSSRPSSCISRTSPSSQMESSSRHHVVGARSSYDQFFLQSSLEQLQLMKQEAIARTTDLAMPTMMMKIPSSSSSSSACDFSSSFLKEYYHQIGGAVVTRKDGDISLSLAVSQLEYLELLGRQSVIYENSISLPPFLLIRQLDVFKQFSDDNEEELFLRSSFEQLSLMKQEIACRMQLVRQCFGNRLGPEFTSALNHCILSPPPSSSSSALSSLRSRLTFSQLEYQQLLGRHQIELESSEIGLNNADFFADIGDLDERAYLILSLKQLSIMKEELLERCAMFSLEEDDDLHREVDFNKNKDNVNTATTTAALRQEFIRSHLEYRHLIEKQNLESDRFIFASGHLLSSSNRDKDESNNNDGHEEVQFYQLEILKFELFAEELHQRNCIFFESVISPFSFPLCERMEEEKSIALLRQSILAPTTTRFVCSKSVSWLLSSNAKMLVSPSRHLGALRQCYVLAQHEYQEMKVRSALQQSFLREINYSMISIDDDSSVPPPPPEVPDDGDDEVVVEAPPSSSSSLLSKRVVICLPSSKLLSPFEHAEEEIEQFRFFVESIMNFDFSLQEQANREVVRLEEYQQRKQQQQQQQQQHQQTQLSAVCSSAAPLPPSRTPLVSETPEEDVWHFSQFKNVSEIRKAYVRSQLEYAETSRRLLLQRQCFEEFVDLIAFSSSALSSSSALGNSDNNVNNNLRQSQQRKRLIQFHVDETEEEEQQKQSTSAGQSTMAMMNKSMTSSDSSNRAPTLALLFASHRQKLLELERSKRLEQSSKSIRDFFGKSKKNKKPEESFNDSLITIDSDDEIFQERAMNVNYNNNTNNNKTNNNNEKAQNESPAPPVQTKNEITKQPNLGHVLFGATRDENNRNNNNNSCNNNKKFPNLSIIRSCAYFDDNLPQREEFIGGRDDDDDVISVHSIGTSSLDDFDDEIRHQQLEDCQDDGYFFNDSVPARREITAADFGRNESLLSDSHLQQQQQRERKSQSPSSTKEEFKIITVPEVRYEPRYSAMDIVFQVCKEEEKRKAEEARLAAEAQLQKELEEAQLMKKSNKRAGGKRSSPSKSMIGNNPAASTASSSMLNTGDQHQQEQDQQSPSGGPAVSAIDLLYNKIISDRIEKHSVELGTVAPAKMKKNKIGSSFLVNLQEPETVRSKTFRESKAYVPVNTCLLNLLASSFGWAPTKTEKWIPNEAVVGPRTFKVQLCDRYIPGTSNASTKLRVAPPAFSLTSFDWSTSFIPRAPIPANVGVNAGKNIFALPNQLFGTAECYPVDSCCTFALFIADESRDRATLNISPSLAAASMYSPWSMKKSPQTGIVFSANVAGRANASRARIVFENSSGVIVQIDGVLPTPQWLVEMSKILVLNPDHVTKEQQKITKDNDDDDDDYFNESTLSGTLAASSMLGTTARDLNATMSAPSKNKTTKHHQNNNNNINQSSGGVEFWCVFSTGNVCNACKLVLPV